MRFSILAVVSALTATAIAAPASLVKRSPVSDIASLNFALTLEHLGAEFYRRGLANRHESTHVTYLSNAIKSLHDHPVPPCKYKFPLNNIAWFVAVSQALENIGTSAYLGAAADLEGDLLTAFGTMVTLESRQSAIVNEIRRQSGIPYPFDPPLTGHEVITLESSLIESCPFTLPYKPFTQLMARLPGKGRTKTENWFQGQRRNVKYWCQFLYYNRAVVSRHEKCALPATAVDYVHVVITDSSTPVSLHDDSHIVAGPVLLFNGSR